MHTGDLLTDLLIRYGVTHVFGAAGGQTVALVDGITRRGSEIQHLMLRDERSTVFAADAYARMTNRIGVCDVTVGPGAVKLPSGLFEAYASSIPVLAVISDIPTGWTHLIDRGGTATQGIDQESLVRPFVKRVATLRSVEQLPGMLNALVRAATTGRAGPVALIVAQDLFDAEIGAEVTASHVDGRYGRFPVERSVPDPQDIEAAAAALVGSQRPALLVGGGALISQAWCGSWPSFWPCRWSPRSPDAGSFRTTTSCHSACWGTSVHRWPGRSLRKRTSCSWWGASRGRTPL